MLPLSVWWTGAMLRSLFEHVDMWVRGGVRNRIAEPARWSCHLWKKNSSAGAILVANPVTVRVHKYKTTRTNSLPPDTPHTRSDLDYCCIYMYINICVYMYVYVCIYTYINIYTYIYACIHIYNTLQHTATHFFFRWNDVTQNKTNHNLKIIIKLQIITISASTTNIKVDHVKQHSTS